MPYLKERIAAAALLFSLAAYANTEPLVKVVAGKATAHARIPKPSAAVEAPPPAPEPVSIPSMTPEELPASAPRVTYSGGCLTIDAANALLVDILNAIQAQTGAVIATPREGSGERVAVHLSGPPNIVIPALLDGSTFGYVIRASPADPEGVQEVVLTRKPSIGAQPGPQTSSVSEQSVIARPFALPTPALKANQAASVNAIADNTSEPKSIATDEAEKSEDKSDPIGQPALQASIVDPHPAPPIQLTADQQSANLAQQQRDTNRQFLQDLYSSRQKLQPQP